MIYDYLATKVYKLEIQEIINEYPDKNRLERIDFPETQVWVTEDKHMLEHQVWQVKDEGVFNHHLSRQPIQIVTLLVYLCQKWCQKMQFWWQVYQQSHYKGHLIQRSCLGIHAMYQGINCFLSKKFCFFQRSNLSSQGILVLKDLNLPKGDYSLGVEKKAHWARIWITFICK